MLTSSILKMIEIDLIYLKYKIDPHYNIFLARYTIYILKTLKKFTYTENSLKFCEQTTPTYMFLYFKFKIFIYFPIQVLYSITRYTFHYYK